MRMRYFVAVAFCLSTGACKQEALLGDGDAGGGGAIPTAGGGGSGASAPDGGNGGGEGGSIAEDPFALGATICESRAACETVETECAHDTGCIFTIFREELWDPMASCLSTCGAFDDCWIEAVENSTPPDEFALYVSACNQSVVDCKGDPESMGHDWCEYDFFSAANYAAMIDCFDVGCHDVNNCLRGVVFATEPSCYDF